MADIRKEDVQKQVSERAREIKQLDEDAKAIRASIERENAELEEIARRRDIQVQVVKALEAFLPKNERWSEWHRTNKKDGDPLALVTLMAEVLENNRDGLNARTILAEVRKLGYRTTSENAQGMVHGSLHRRKDLFYQLKDKTWILKKYLLASGPLTEEANLFAKLLKGDFPPVPAGQSGAPLPEGIRRLKLQK